DTTTSQMMGLEELADGIHHGVVVLPDFQRDFDWSERDVRELLITVLNGWPAGSILIMRGVPSFRVRSFESAPAALNTPEFVVLDGQQRLTALYQALYGMGKHVFALDYGALLTGEPLELEDAITAVERQDWDDSYGALIRANLLPMYALRSPSE